MKLKRWYLYSSATSLLFFVGCSGLSGLKHPAGLVGTYELDSMDIKTRRQNPVHYERAA